MKRLRQLKIRAKLTLIVMITSCAALLLACGAFVVNDLITYRKVMLRDLTTRAQIIGNNSTAALTFGDPKPVEEIMAALSADQNLVAACVFKADQQILASYRRPGAAVQLPPATERTGAWFSSEHLHLFHDIMFNGQRIGSVFLQADLEGLHSRLQRDAVITALVMLGAIGVALVLSARLQRAISDPITELAATAVQVARDKDFAVRVEKRSEDEVGYLVEAFNEMLAQIQERDAALQQAHDELEERVQDRTHQLRGANEQLNREVEQRRRSQKELESMQQRLMEASRQAGMAEIATGVLHNVGNVLNSVNVSATLVQEQLRQSKVASLLRITQLLREHATELGDFLTHDPKGRRIPEFLDHLASHLETEQGDMLKELESLGRNIEHIKEIVSMQQSYARVAGVIEHASAEQLVEDALRISEARLASDAIQVVRQFSEVPSINIDKHKALQILINLISNARHALLQGGPPEKQLTLRLSPVAAGRIIIQVIDNGIGIAPQNLTRIFAHGFTTKRDGHGFGLHSGALAARQMGGSLTVRSSGLGQGAEFTLELPIQPEARPPSETRFWTRPERPDRAA